MLLVDYLARASRQLSTTKVKFTYRWRTSVWDRSKYCISGVDLITDWAAEIEVSYWLGGKFLIWRFYSKSRLCSFLLLPPNQWSGRHYWYSLIWDYILTTAAITCGPLIKLCSKSLAKWKARLKLWSRCFWREFQFDRWNSFMSFEMLIYYYSRTVESAAADDDRRVHLVYYRWIFVILTLSRM